MSETTLDAIASRVETLEGQVKEIFGRLNDKDIGPSVLATKLNQVLITLGEVKKAVDDLKDRPGHRWDTLINTSIGAIIAALVGILSAHIH